MGRAKMKEDLIVIPVEIIMNLRLGTGCVHTSLRKHVHVQPRLGGAVCFVTS